MRKLQLVFTAAYLALFPASVIADPASVIADTVLNPWVGRTPTFENEGKDFFDLLLIQRNALLDEEDNHPNTTWGLIYPVSFDSFHLGDYISTGYFFTQCREGRCQNGRSQWRVLPNIAGKEYNVYYRGYDSEGILQICKISTPKPQWFETEVPEWRCRDFKDALFPSADSSEDRNTAAKEIYDGYESRKRTPAPREPICRTVWETYPLPDGGCCRSLPRTICE